MFTVRECDCVHVQRPFSGHIFHMHICTSHIYVIIISRVCWKWWLSSARKCHHHRHVAVHQHHVSIFGIIKSHSTVSEEVFFSSFSFIIQRYNLIYWIRSMQGMRVVFIVSIPYTEVWITLAPSTPVRVCTVDCLNFSVAHQIYDRKRLSAFIDRLLFRQFIYDTWASRGAKCYRHP